MKKLLGLLLLCLSVGANAQFTPGQLLTAAELNNQFALYAPLGGAVFTGPITATATTQGRLDNSTSLATDQFVNQQGASAVATVPFANVAGGIYNQATLGTGCQVVVFTSGGVITSSLTIGNPGSGYAVGDLLAVPAGNSDAVLRVTGVSGGGVTSVGIAYGGTGYTTGNVVTTMGVPPGRRAVNFTGTLTSNLTFIIQSGTFLTASREVEFLNNTTGAFTITVKLSNGVGGSTGTGVVLPQGTNNSTALTVYTDGVTDVWLSNVPAAPGIVPLSSLAPQAANTVVGNSTGSTASPTAITVTGCNGAAQALQWTNGSGFGCNSAIATSGANANITSLSGLSTALSILQGGTGATSAGAALTNLGAAPLASPTFTGTPAAPTAAAGTNTTQLATTANVVANFATPPTAGYGSTTPEPVAATTLSSTGNFTPSQTNGIVGTTTSNSVNAGSVGEYITNTASGVSLTTGTAVNVTSTSLTAGDWDAECIFNYSPAGSTVPSLYESSLNNTSGALSTNFWQNTFDPNTHAAGAGTTQVTAVIRESLPSTTTVYCVALSNFTASTMTVNGFFRARRVR
jgi:hypothetical protein